MGVLTLIHFAPLALITYAFFLKSKAFIAVVHKMKYLSIHILPILVTAIILANIISEFGITSKIALIFKPIIKFANLSEESMLSVVTYLASGSAGSAMLASFHEQGAIDEKETIVASFVSSFFSFVNHVFVYFVPVVIPLLGLKAGLMYIGARMFISFCVTLTAIFAGHFVLKSNSKSDRAKNKKNTSEKNSDTSSMKVKLGIKKSLKVLKKILPRLIVVYAITAILLSYGVFKPIENIRILSLPGQASAIVAAGIVDTTSGFAAAGSLLSSHAITPIQAVAALLLASIMSMSVIFVRHSLPGRIAYFGVRLGFKIAVVSSLINIFYTLIVLLFILGVHI